MENANVEECLEECLEVEIVDPYGFIYVTMNMVNGKKYIGQRKFTDGWKWYLGSGLHIKRAINKHGRENFIRNIIAIAYSKEELNNLEIEFIKNHNAVESNDYYNLAYGGKGGFIIEHGSFYNKHHSNETKIKMSLSSLKMSDDTRNKISETRLKSSNKDNINKSKEITFIKISEAMKGRDTKFSDPEIIEIREKYSTGEYTYRQLAREYNCDHTLISRLINFKGAYKKLTNNLLSDSENGVQGRDNIGEK